MKRLNTLIEKIKMLLPEKLRKKNGIWFLIFMWTIPIPTFEIFWLLTGVTDPLAIYGMPATFAVLTVAILKWSMKVF